MVDKAVECKRLCEVRHRECECLPDKAFDSAAQVTTAALPAREARKLQDKRSTTNRESHPQMSVAAIRPPSRSLDICHVPTAADCPDNKVHFSSRVRGMFITSYKCS